MRTCYAGDGSNSTAAVQAYLNSTSQPLIYDLYIIGQPEDPYSIWMTNYESPLNYNLYPEQTFMPAVVSRGSVASKIGLEVATLDITWAPGNQTFTNNVATTSPLQLAQTGYYDNWNVYVFRVYMPTKGDCNTLGACPLFGGRIADTTVDRIKIKWSVNSFLDVLSQQVPINVIEATNGYAGFVGATPPAGFSVVPQFATFTGSTDTVLLGDVQSPYGVHHIFGNHVFKRGWVIFLPVPGATLAGFYSAIADNIEFTDGIGGHHNQITVYGGFPWPPTPWSGTSGDQFILSAALPNVRPAPAWIASTAYPLDYQIIDSNSNVQTVIAPGTSAGSAPAWGSTPGSVTTDGANLVWSYSGPASAIPPDDFPFVPQPEQAF